MQISSLLTISPPSAIDHAASLPYLPTLAQVLAVVHHTLTPNPLSGCDSSVCIVAQVTTIADDSREIAAGVPSHHIRRNGTLPRYSRRSRTLPISTFSALRLHRHPP